MRTRLLVSAAVSVGALLVASPPALAAGPAIQITKIYYDSPGKDTRSNTSLNAEYVWLKNTSSKTVAVTGWTLADTSRHRYIFPAFSIPAGKTITIRTGSGKSGTSTRYWGMGNYVWNNDKDTASLRNAGGKLIDSCSYNSTKVSYKIC
ncbi:UNVERIFIED_ORG: putative extracellular nuclease [Microbispora rosea subsp. rosea]